jgi:hypothetical protein
MHIIQYYVAILMNAYNVSALNTKTNAILQHHLALYYLCTLPHLIGSVNCLFIWHLSLKSWTSKLQIRYTGVWSVSYLKNDSKHIVWIIILTENIISCNNTWGHTPHKITATYTNSGYKKFQLYILIHRVGMSGMSNLMPLRSYTVPYTSTSRLQ